MKKYSINDIVTHTVKAHNIKDDFASIKLVEEAIEMICNYIFLNYSDIEDFINRLRKTEFTKKGVAIRILYLLDLYIDKKNRLVFNEYLNLLRWFFDDYLYEEIPCEIDNIITTTKSMSITHPSIVSYDWLLKKGWTKEEIFIDTLKLEENFHIDLHEEKIDKNKHIIAFMYYSRDWISFLEYDGKVIGYIFLSPISGADYAKYLKSKCNLSKCGITKGKNEISVVNFAILEEFRNIKNIKLLLKEIENTISKYTTNKILISNVCTIATNKEGERLCKILGAKKLKKNIYIKKINQKKESC